MSLAARPGLAGGLPAHSFDRRGSSMRRRAFLLASLGLLAWPRLAAAATKPAVTLVLKSLRNPFFSVMTAGARRHHAQHSGDYQLTIDGVQGETDLAGQIKIVEACIARREQILLITPADSRAIIPALIKAVQSGLLVINLDNKLDDRALASHGVNIPFVGPSNFSGARAVGDYVLRALKPRSKAAIIEGLPGSINAKARSDGYREAIASANMTLAALAWGDWERDAGRAAALKLMKQTPDLAALLCGNDNMAIGAAQAVTELKRDGKVLIGGYDNIPEMAALLASKRIYATADQHPALQAEYAIRLGLESFNKRLTQSEMQSIVRTPVDLVKS
ncbi:MULTISPECIES: substrate-binding domain-containing protein [Chromobacterium]|nr:MULTISPECIES: substrate-binding domain-containing protein [Chromobacterium]MCP1292793.1 substrate-binding domain-containing protein [Chromobacterium sp. S0633]